MDEILNLIESVSECFPSYSFVWEKVNYFFCIQLNELMKLNEYQRSRSFFDLGQRSFRFQS